MEPTSKQTRGPGGQDRLPDERVDQGGETTDSGQPEPLLGVTVLDDRSYIVLEPAERKRLLGELHAAFRRGTASDRRYLQWLYERHCNAIRADYVEAYKSPAEALGLAPDAFAHALLKGLPTTDDGLNATRDAGVTLETIAIRLGALDERPAKLWLKKCDPPLLQRMAQDEHVRNSPVANRAIRRVLSRRGERPPAFTGGHGPADNSKPTSIAYLGKEFSEQDFVQLDEQKQREALAYFDHQMKVGAAEAGPVLAFLQNCVQVGAAFDAYVKDVRAQARRKFQNEKSEKAKQDEKKKLQRWSFVLHQDVVKVLKVCPKDQSCALRWIGQTNEILLETINNKKHPLVDKCSEYYKYIAGSIRVPEGGIYVFKKQGVNRWVEIRGRRFGVRASSKSEDAFKKLFAEVGATCTFLT